MSKTGKGGVKRFMIEFVKRVYAIGVIALVSWLSFLALRYLIVGLMVPNEAPEQIVGVPVRFTQDVLRTRRSEWEGLQVGDFPRAPVAHYHQLNGWITPDQANNCTQSGCHVPLPHSEDKAVRAFLNMHATSMHCGVCHMQADANPIPTAWYDLQTGEKRGRPALFELYAWLTSDAGRTALEEPTSAHQVKIVDLLEEAAGGAGDIPRLNALAEHLAAVRYSSPAFKEYVAALREALPRSFRGEYGAKLTLQGSGGDPVLGHPGNSQAVQEFLGSDSLTADRRQQLVDQIHTRKRAAAVVCSDCHATEPTRLAFEEAGYPPARVQALQRGPVFRMIQRIDQGQAFHLPEFIAPESDTAAPTPDADQE